MSRIGKQPIAIPSGVKVEFHNGVLKASGPKGSLEYRVRPEIEVQISEGTILVKRPNDERRNRAYHGLTRSLINNIVVGVTKGFERSLEINGVGFRSEVQGNTLVLNVGYSHPIRFDLPQGISARVEKQNRIVVEGCDKQAVGETAAKIRAFRPPEPYKGKGIKYAEETIRRKVGKSGGK